MMVPEELPVPDYPESMVRPRAGERDRLLLIMCKGLACLVLVVLVLMLLTISLPVAANSMGSLMHFLHLDSLTRYSGNYYTGYVDNWSHGYTTTSTYWYLTSTKSYELQRAMAATLGPTLLLSATFGIIAIAGAIASQTKLIEVQRDGIAVRRRRGSPALFVPWESLRKVEVCDAGKWLGTKNYRIVFHRDDGLKVAITWRDVLCSRQGPPMLNALKTWAPDAIASGKLPVPGIDDTQTNYTQMWLQYFSAPARRERSTDLETGTTVGGGKYTIAGKLSGGGHGTTYLSVVDRSGEPQTGNNAELSRDVVIKEYVLPVHRGSLVLDRTIEKLNQEAAILGRISHPQIVRLLDSFVEDYRGYLVMEYVQGVSLKDLVEREGPLQEDLVCRLAVQMCDVLANLHGLSPPIVHRDFTPDNLILQDNMLIKLVDFNVAHELEGSVTATVVGKHSYLPPEQFRGKPVPQSDIYAFGCTLFFLLTGSDPEPISTSHPRDHREGISEELDSIVARATALDAIHRYPDAGSMAAEIAALVKRAG